MNIKEVTELTGVSSRTLRYYEEIGLLTPERNQENDYRNYQQKDLDRLYQIFLYKRLDFPLKEIKQILQTENPSTTIFTTQLKLLKEQEKSLQETIEQLENYLKGVDSTMKKQFKDLEAYISENETKYGKDVTEKYGADALKESNEHLRKGGQEAFEKGNNLREAINETLADLVNRSISFKSNAAKDLFQLHQAWLKIYYPKYSSAYHLGLADLYEADERFAKNYDDVVAGGNAYLVEVIRFWASKN